MKTEILTVDPVHPDPEAVARAADVVRRGGVVAFPTETVYGLGVDAGNAEAVARLRRLKGREADKPFTLHVARVEDVLARARPLPWRARKLVARYWPGPLTLVLADRDGNATGFRVPSGAVPRTFLAACGRPVAAPSANFAGEPPACTAEEVRRVFDGRIDAILDGGAAPLRQSSTVVRATESGIDVLREGIISAEQIRQTATRLILLVCTGNTCRSPMAEALLRRLLADRFGTSLEGLADKGFRIASAGLCAGTGGASPHAAAAVAARGGDLSRHQARSLTADMLRAADLVYTMTRAQREQAVEMAPDAAERIRLLGPAGEEVADPVWGDLEVYRACAAEIERLLRQRLDEIAGEA